MPLWAVYLYPSTEPLNSGSLPTRNADSWSTLTTAVVDSLSTRLVDCVAWSNINKASHDIRTHLMHTGSGPALYICIHVACSHVKYLLSPCKNTRSHFFLSLAAQGMAIPVIDMKNLNGSQTKVTMAQIANACEEWGFFQLLNHGVPHRLLDRVREMCTQHYQNCIDKEFKESAAVLTLRNALKSHNTWDIINDVDWEYAFFLQHSLPSQPSLNSDFREAMEEFATEIRKLAERILEIMCENLGLERGYLKQVLSGGGAPFFGTKVSHYPPCPRPDLIRGLRAHTDAGGIILLFQDDKVGGLQVLKDGCWVDVQPIHNAIVIDIGDQIEVITNGKYKSAWHRVLATEDGNRMSVASFYNPSRDAVVYPAPPLTSPNGGKYPKFVSADYMRVYQHQKFLPKEPRFEAMKTVEAMKSTALINNNENEIIE